MSNVFADIREDMHRMVAKNLLIAGALLADEAKKDLQTGQNGFPKMITGSLANSIVLSATTPEGVIDDGMVVRLGMKAIAPKNKNASPYYGYILMKHGWKNLPATMERLKPKLNEIIQKGK